MIILILSISAIVLAIVALFGCYIMKDGFDMSEPGAAVGGLLLALFAFALAIGQVWIMAVLGG